MPTSPPPHAPMRRLSGRARGALLAALVCAFVAALLGGAAGHAQAQPPAPEPEPGPPSSSQPPPIVVDPQHPVVPAPPASQQGPDVESESEDCGVLDIVCKAGEAINDWFTELVTSAMDPVLDLVGRTSMTTPDLASNPQISQLWEITRWVANSLFILFVIVGGIVIASHETLQTRVTLKETLPRIVVGFIAINASLSLIGMAISFVNGIATGILAGDSANGISTGVKDEIHRQLEEGGIFMILIALAALVLAVVLLALYVLRLTITIVLVVAGPLALVCHASPYTEGVAKLWWRGLFGVLAIQILQAVTLIVFVKVFFVQGPGATDLLGVSGGLMNMVISIVLLFILIKIPSWVLQQVGLGGRSTVASIVKYAMLAKGLRMLGVGKGAGAASQARTRRGGSGGTGTRPRGRGPTGGPLPGGRTTRQGLTSAAAATGAQRVHNAARTARERAGRAWAAPARMASNARQTARERRQAPTGGGLTPTSGASVPAMVTATPSGTTVAAPIESTPWGSPDQRRRSRPATAASPPASKQSTTAAQRSAGTQRAATAAQARDRTMPRRDATPSAGQRAQPARQAPRVQAPQFQAPGAAPSSRTKGGSSRRDTPTSGRKPAARQPGAPRGSAAPTPRTKKGGR